MKERERAREREEGVKNDEREGEERVIYLHLTKPLNRTCIP